MHSSIAIGSKIDAIVRSPHRTDILRRVVGQVFGRAVLEIVNPNVVSHSTAIMLPGAEFAEDPVKRHFRIVWRKGNETSARHWQLLGQFRVEPDGEKLANEVVERFHPGTEDDQWFGILPGHHQIVGPHPVGDIVATEGGGSSQSFGSATFSGHDIDFGVAVVLGGKGELRSIRREMRERSITWAGGDSAGNAAFFSDSVKFAGVTKNDLAAIGSWKP